MHEIKIPENFTDNVMEEIAMVEKIRAGKRRLLKIAGGISACSVSVCATVYILIHTGALSAVVGFLEKEYQWITGYVRNFLLWIPDTLGSVFRDMDLVPSYYVTPVFLLACAGLLMDCHVRRKNMRHNNP